jgi:16S rRNA (cytidine1402-2'-O)-methyltransferase
MEPGLYIVGTPIGHLGDITLRALETLREADLILAEDTRHSRKLLNHYEIQTPLSSYHKFNEAARTDGIVRKILEASQAIALVTSAGMPAVSDPGARLARACRDAGAMVTVVPGPSAVSAALAWSGYGGSGFHFEGFLAPKKGARARRLQELSGSGVPVLLFESPYRVVKLLNEIAANMDDPEVFVAREMTKRFEEGLCGRASELAAEFEARSVKGEFVVIVAPTPRRRAGKREDDPPAVRGN